jgi:hypothetical protein
MLRKVPQMIALFALAVFTLSAQTLAPPRHFAPDLNKQAINLAKPTFPDVSLENGADGSQLTMRVVVSTAGMPISAVCSTTCHPLLKDAAEFAAMNSTFKTLVIDGKSLEYEGNLSYSYVVQRVEWARFGAALESVRQFKNISAGVVAAMLSDEYADERAKLIALDANGVHRVIKQKTIYDVEISIRNKLKGVDRWRFNASIALRRITFITDLVGEVDREDLAAAFGVIGQYAKAAPAEVPRELVENLTRVSEYKIPANITDSDLKKAIFELARNIRW